LDATTWSVTPDPAEVDNGSANVCSENDCRSLSPATFTLADYLTSASQSVTLTVYNVNGISDTCTTSITLKTPSDAQLLRMPAKAALYSTFTMSWPVLSDFSESSPMTIKIVDPAVASNFVMAFNGVYGTGKAQHSVQKLSPNKTYNVEVTIGQYPMFIGATIFLKIR
jgi:hypothetical protein